MRLSKRVFLSALAALLVGGLAAAQAQAAEWRMAHKMPPDSPEGKVFQRFADLTEQYSGGELMIKMFPNEQLGKTNAVMEQLKLGTVHLYAEGSTYMKKWVPEITWISAAFLFDDREHWVRFMNTDMVKGWYQKASEQAGVGVLGDPTAIMRGPYRVMVTTRDVKAFDDVKGLKLRMHPNKDAVATWTRIGADVKTLAWTDVYQAIDKGIVSAVNSPIALVESMRFYEVAPHVVRHDEYYQSIGFMVNQQAYDALSDELKAVVNRAYDEAGTYSFEVMGRAADESIERMKSKGVTFVEVDRSPFVETMAGFYQDKESAGELPEGYLATVAATRASN
jgi:TRAP-type C4-dicarboxylate transport system substrate-binding protein